MGGNKKFIDKKTSATYQLICRANDDGDDPAASLADERVLARVDTRASAGEILDDGERSLRDDRSVVTASSSQYTRSGRLTRARRAELIELGFPDDGYDYLQHCRVIGASGGAGATFVPVVVKPVLDDDERVYDARDAVKPTAVTALQVEDTAKVARNAELAELVEAMKEARTLPVEHKARSEAATTGAVAPGGGGQAAGRVEGEGADDVLEAGDLEDDFILSVLDAESLPPRALDTVLEALTEDDEDGSDCTDRDDLGEAESEEEGEHSGAPPDDALASSAAQQRARRAQRQVDDAFDALAAAEYDSDDIGELDESDPSARGRADVSAYGSVLDGFRASSEGATALAAARAAAQADRLADGLTSGSDGGEEFSSELSSDEGDDEEEETPEDRESKLALQVTRLRLGLPISGRLRTEGDEEVIEHLMGGVGEAQAKDDDLMELRPIDVHVRERNPWDCETIVSTYSNAENRPRVLDDGGPARRAPRTGSRAAANVSSAPQVIRLGKTGLPVDYLPAARHAAATSAPPGDEAHDGTDGVDVASDAPWRAQIRRRGETAEEKHARKAAVKEGRREARATKKDTKLLFQQEAKATRPAHVSGAVRPGTSVTPLL